MPLGGGDTLGEAAEDPDQFPGPALDAVQGGAGEGVEDAVAVAAAEVQDGAAPSVVNDHAIGLMPAWAGHAVGVQPTDEPVIALSCVYVAGRTIVHPMRRMEVEGRR